MKMIGVNMKNNCNIFNDAIQDHQCISKLSNCNLYNYIYNLSKDMMIPADKRYWDLYMYSGKPYDITLMDIYNRSNHNIMIEKWWNYSHDIPPTLDLIAAFNNFSAYN